MNEIIVKKDGIYHIAHSRDEVTERVDSFIPYLNRTIDIEADVTFEDFFNHIMNDVKTYSMIFASQLGHYNLEDFVDEWAKPVPERTAKDKMKFLHVYRDDIRIVNNSDEDELVWVYFGGWGEYTDHEGNTADIGYAVEFTPINELKQYPLKLETKTKICKNYFDEFESTRLAFTVYDVIGAILYEISWSGSPAVRDNTRDELYSTVQTAQEELENGTAVLKSADEVFDSIKQRITEKTSEGNG